MFNIHFSVLHGRVIPIREFTFGYSHEILHGLEAFLQQPLHTDKYNFLKPGLVKQYHNLGLYIDRNDLEQGAKRLMLHTDGTFFDVKEAANETRCLTLYLANGIAFFE